MTLLTTNGENKSGKATPTLELLSKTRDGVYAVDEEQRIVLWNQGAQEILGYSAEETIGRYCFEVVRGTDEDGRRVCGRDCNTQTTMRQGRPGCGLNILVRAKDGTPRWLSLSHIPVSPSGNGSNAVVHVFRDATKEVEAKQLVARLSSFFAEYARSEEEAPAAVAPYTKLTQREIEVLRLLSKGSATESIAQKLGISSTTARNHIQNILSKLGVHSRLEAVVQASRYNLL
jgi:PAS domain S-box-containing protein